MSRFVSQLVLVCLLAFGCSIKGQHREMSAHAKEEQFIRNAKANEVLKYMNPEADPCNDFYDFACGKWPEYQPPLTEADTPISVQTQLEMRVNKDVQVLLDEPVRHREHSNMNDRKIKDFYKSCLNAENPSALQQTFLLNFVKKYGGLPLIAVTNWNMNYDWVLVIAKLRLHYGFDILIGLEVENSEPTLQGNSQIYLTEPKTTLIPPHLCNAMATQETDVRDEVYDEMQKVVATNMQSWFTLKEAEATRFAGDIIRIEFELCKHMRREDDAPPPEENKTGRNRLNGYSGRTLAQLTNQFRNAIHFKKFVDISLNSTVMNTVQMRSEKYFHHLSRLALTNPPQTFTNYIMYRALSMINFPADDSATTRPTYCVQLVLRYFPKVVGEMYNKKYHRSHVRTDVEQLFSATREALKESLNADRLPENVRSAARNKLLTLNTLEFPVYQSVDLRQLPLEQKNFWNKQDIVMTYNAERQRTRFYGPEAEAELEGVEATDVYMKLSSNGVSTGWGILQPPFYDYFYPSTLKYALIGQRIARELVFAVDEEGMNLSPRGSPWDEETNENFQNISECYRTQYSNYLHNTPNAFYNTTKLRELMADSSGLNIAFNAYLAWLESMDPSNRGRLLRETLTGVNFTNTQLFFISFAQTRCNAKYEEQPPPEFLPLDKHTEERYNVNGPLANNVEFAREFGCSAGTDMNPDDKCVLY